LPILRWRKNFRPKSCYPGAIFAKIKLLFGLFESAAIDTSGFMIFSLRLLKIFQLLFFIPFASRIVLTNRMKKNTIITHWKNDALEERGSTGIPDAERIASNSSEML